jgi:hypothetical protein
MNNDGSVRVKEGSSEHILLPTDTAVTQLLNKLPGCPTIPSRFASQIPADLVAYNVNRLIMDASEENLVFRCRTRDDGVSILRGIVTEKYSPLSHCEVLEKAIMLNNLMGFKEAKKSYMTDDFIRLCTVSDSFKTEFTPGDITKFGFQVVNGETGLRRFELKLYCYRLICQNGLVIPEEFGGVSKRHIGDVMTAFGSGIGSIYSSIFKFKEEFNKIMRKPISVLNMSSRSKISELLTPKEEVILYESSDNVFNYIQSVTEAGKAFSEQVRTSVEEAAGQLLLAAA